MANLRTLKDLPLRRERISSFIESHKFHFADKGTTSEAYIEMLSRDHSDSQILICQERPGLKSIVPVNDGPLILFGEEVGYPIETLLKLVDAGKLSIPEFIKHSYDVDSAAYRASEEYNALLSSCLGAIVVALSDIDEMAIHALNYLDPWKPISVHVVPEDWALNSSRIRIANENIGNLATTASTCTEIYYRNYYNVVGQIRATDGQIFAGASRLRPVIMSKFSNPVSSLVDQIKKGTLLKTWVSQKLTDLIDHYDIERQYEFGLPTQEKVDSITTDRYVFFAGPDEIKEYRKTEEGSLNKDKFSSTRIAKLGMYLLNPVKGDSLTKFWFYKSKALDAWTVESLVDDFMQTECSINMSSATSYINKPKYEVTFDLGRSEVTDNILHIHSHLLQRSEVMGSNANVYSLLQHEAKFAMRVALQQTLALLDDPDMDPQSAGIIAQDVLRQELLTNFKPFFEIYEKALGGKIDLDIIKKSKFSLYYDNLTKAQKVRLREYINQGEVNEDVLNNQPMTVWLLLSTNSSLNRIRTKKTKIFDSMKFLVKPPKWLMNKILDPPEGVNPQSLNEKKQLFYAVKQTWGSQLTWAWILHEEPKIFSDLGVDVLVNFMAYTNAIEAWEYNADSQFHKQNYYFNRDKAAPPRGVGGVPDGFNFGKIRKLYEEWKNDLPSDTESKAYKIAVKVKEYEWKQFAIEFRAFIDAIFSEYRGTDSHTVFKPNCKSWEALSDARNIGTEQAQFNDLFVYVAYLYGALSGTSPLDGWVNFSSFIWQTNRWFKDAESWHNRLVGLRDNNRSWEFRLKEDTEQFIREMIQESGSWYEWRGQRGYYNTARAALIDDGSAHLDNPDTGINPTAYRATRDLFPLLVNRCLTIPKKGTANIKDMKENLYEPVPGVDYIEKDGFIFKQILNEYDLKQEGKNMSHCVGGFNNACELGASVIFHMTPATKVDKDGKAWPKNMTTTLEWNPKGTKREVYGRVVKLANGRATEYVQGQHYSFNNQTANQKNQEAARKLLRSWNRIMASEEFHFFNGLMQLFDKLAQLNGFKDFHTQLHPPKPAKKNDVVVEEKQVNKYANKLQIALGNVPNQPDRHRNDDQIQVNII